MTSKSAPSARSTKFVYSFGGGTAEGDGSQKNLLGGKGANLAEMARIGLPVPPGFTMSTEVCTYYYANGRTYPKGLEKVVDVHLAGVEKKLGKKFGDPKNPLLVSVRSGARASMPGMMDTILNLGLNDVTVEGLAKASGNPRFAWDCYRRFVAMYGDVVLDLKPVGKHERDPFEVILEAKKEKFGAHLDTELTVEALKELVGEFKKAIKDKTGHVFPEDPMAQLWGAIGAVFSSWMNERAIVYRQLNSIPESWGTAVNVQSMVFGNLGEDCGTGVAFTRDPATGENLFYGEYLINAQGEDVVAGIRTPQKIATLQQAMPKVYDQLSGIRQKLEKHYRDMQDIEFTVERGRLFMLQTRTAKRTGFAEVRIAVEMEREKLITAEEAILRVNPDSLNQLLRPVFDPAARNAAVAEGQLLAKGLNAGPGAATGRVVFSAQDAFEWAKRGEKVLLVREETSPEDIKGMNAAEGILTATGRHDLSRGPRRPPDGQGLHRRLRVAPDRLRPALHDRQGRREEPGRHGRRLALHRRLDGRGPRGAARDEALRGPPGSPREEPRPRGEPGLHPLRDDDGLGRQGPPPPRPRERRPARPGDQRGPVRRRGNRPLPHRAHVLRRRPDHGRPRDDPRRQRRGPREGPRQAPADAAERLRGGLPGDGPAPRHDPDDRPAAPRVPAAHPRRTGGRRREARRLVGDRGPEGERAPRDEPDARPPRLPPAGSSTPRSRGCRRAPSSRRPASCKKNGIDVKPEIMIPLVGHVNELKDQERVVRETAKDVFAKAGITVDYLVGTMIELPRAALTADEIATVAEFFSYGTNDLTQTTFGLSRDDAGKFLPEYVRREILPSDPFEKIDQGGVGKLVKMGVELGRTTRPKLKIGICGEHGGEPSSVEFCHRTGLDYVSCSPFRIPIARLAAGQAAVREGAKVSGKTAKAAKAAPKAAPKTKAARQAARRPPEESREAAPKAKVALRGRPRRPRRRRRSAPKKPVKAAREGEAGPEEAREEGSPRRRARR